MSRLQEASDVFAKWREDSILLPKHDSEVPIRLALVNGTAGNPDLLDAIQGLLWRGTITESSVVRMYADLIADAILAADERMRS